jgi:NADH:ubiquinone oxidoreductase subunit 5 (subunit L)/multisubunit Na+/H+ antiporter MnhA subunit
MNRVGDLGFLLGVILLFTIVRSLDFSVLFIVVPVYYEHFNAVLLVVRDFEITYLDVICGSFFIGVIGKSAQLGLHT